MRLVWLGGIAAASILCAPLCAQATPMPGMEEMDMDMSIHSPIDYGPGPNKIKAWTFQPAAASARTSPAAAKAQVAAATAAGWVSSSYVTGWVSNGGPTAGTDGYFDAPVSWPIIGLHEVLLPDGRVLNYGADTSGIQGAEMWYDIWDPSKGTGSAAHSVLRNTMGTDIFCSGQSLIWTTGQVLITGGDLTVGGVRNYANNVTTIFDPTSNLLSTAGYMQYPRWYPTIVDMPDNDMVVLGGRSGSNGANIPQIVPEVYNPATGWRTLTGATSSAAFGNTNGWYYPRAFLAPAGNIFLVNSDGTMYWIDKAGAGTITRWTTTSGARTLLVKTTISSRERPTQMFLPGKLISLRLGGTAEIIDINGAKPVITPIAPPDHDRIWANATVLADGTVWVNGGSAVANNLASAYYTSQLWDPATGLWRTTASAQKARLYHSIAMLMPDGTVLTGSGGAPGPVRQLNAETYYPPYLYLKDGSGNPAPRPTLVTAPANATVGGSISATVGPTDVITAVNLIRSPSVTHSTDPDSRFIPLSFTQSGNQITATLPANPNVLLPGYYMLFALSNGVPSIAKIMLVSLPAPGGS